MSGGNFGRKSDGRFAHGNPGKPSGARHRATLAVEALFEGEAEAIGRKAVELALAGDTVALRLVLDRLAPPRKTRAVALELADTSTAAGCAEAIAAVMRAVSSAEITPDEGQTLASLVEMQRRTIETRDLELRISALEEIKS